MRDKSYEYITCGLAAVFLMLLLGLAAAVTPVVQAEGGLPDRATPVPDGGGSRGDDDSDGQKHPPGATIELRQGPAGAWSVVQWQDINGDWQDVEGWRGVLDETGSRRWWVAAKDFGTGPFRWLVGDSTAPTAVSEPFNLPRFPNETLWVQVAVAP